MQQLIIPLTETERDFAEKNHYLILSFLERNGLSMDEYYDILIFRYLRAVKKHFEEKERKTDFVTEANKALGLALRDCLKYDIPDRCFPHRKPSMKKTYVAL